MAAAEGGCATTQRHVGRCQAAAAHTHHAGCSKPYLRLQDPSPGRTAASAAASPWLTSQDEATRLIPISSPPPRPPPPPPRQGARGWISQPAYGAGQDGPNAVVGGSTAPWGGACICLGSRGFADVADGCWRPTWLFHLVLPAALGCHAIQRACFFCDEPVGNKPFLDHHLTAIGRERTAGTCNAVVVRTCTRSTQLPNRRDFAYILSFRCTPVQQTRHDDAPNAPPATCKPAGLARTLGACSELPVHGLITRRLQHVMPVRAARRSAKQPASVCRPPRSMGGVSPFGTGGRCTDQRGLVGGRTRV